MAGVLGKWLKSARFARWSGFATGVNRSNVPFRGFLSRKTTPRGLYGTTPAHECGGSRQKTLKPSIELSNINVPSPEADHREAACEDEAS
jgi:hypothetical protein